MKKVYLLYVILINIIPVSIYAISMVTTENGSAGRMGDQLLLYCKGKFQAKRLNLPFLFKPFANSHLLVLHEKEMHYNSMTQGQFRRIQKINYERGMSTRLDPDTLYEAQFFGHSTFIEDVMQDRELVFHLREMIKPRAKTEKFNLPTDAISIAVHVRKGGGYDRPLFSRQYYSNEDVQYAQISKKNNDQKQNFQDGLNPTKFPPEQFYVDQIVRLSEMFGNQPLYVYLFTDDQNPQRIVESFEIMINKPNIIFNFRKEGNHFNKNIVEDMCAMAEFDCLIRPESAFSIISQLIGHHKIVIYPETYKWYDNILVINKVTTMVRTDDFKERYEY